MAALYDLDQLARRMLADLFPVADRGEIVVETASCGSVYLQLTATA